MDYSHLLTPSLGVGGVVVLAVVMLLRGDIVPRRQVDAEMKQKDDAIALWKDAYQRSENQNERKDALISGLMETAQTTRNVLHALPEAARIHEGGNHASSAQE